MSFDLFKAFVLGVVEGLTEFLPVSSTGHLLLVQRFFGFDDEDFGKTFAVLIQFGAILALLSIYFFRLWRLAIGMFSDPAARRFVIGVLIAFLPAAVVGALAHDFIKAVLFNVWIVCFTLIVGGAILLWVDSLDLKPRYDDATRFTLPMYFAIGVAQCLAMIPGRVALGRHHRVRHAARRRPALGGGILVLARDADHGRRLRLRPLQEPRAAEHGQRDPHRGRLRGLVRVCAWIVVKTFLGYVQRHGFALFAWWRVIVGTLGLIALALGLLTPTLRVAHATRPLNWPVLRKRHR